MAGQRFYVCQDATEFPLNRGQKRRFLLITTAIHSAATPQDPYLCDISTAGMQQIPGLKEMYTGSGRTAILAFKDGYAEEYVLPASARQMVDDVDTGKRNIGRIWLNPPPKPKEGKEKATKKQVKSLEQAAKQQNQPTSNITVENQDSIVSLNPTKKEPKKRTARSVRIGVPNRPTAPVVTR
jgi:hypothetical protein